VSFHFRTQRLADTLSIVATGGFKGIQYNYPIASLGEDKIEVPKAEWQVGKSEPFLAGEFEEYLILAWRDGLVDRDGYSEDKIYGCSYKSADDETVRLTIAGWRFPEERNVPRLKRWMKQIADNIPTIVASVVAVIIGRALLLALGLLQ